MKFSFVQRAAFTSYGSQSLDTVLTSSTKSERGDQNSEASCAISSCKPQIFWVPVDGSAQATTHQSPSRSAPHRAPEDVLVPSPSAGERGTFSRRTASFAFQVCFKPRSWESSIITPLRTAGMWLLQDNRSPGLSASNSSEVWFPNKAHAPLNSPYRCY